MPETPEQFIERAKAPLEPRGPFHDQMDELKTLLGSDLFDLRTPKSDEVVSFRSDEVQFNVVYKEDGTVDYDQVHTGSNTTTVKSILTRTLERDVLGQVAETIELSIDPDTGNSMAVMVKLYPGGNAEVTNTHDITFLDSETGVYLVRRALTTIQRKLSSQVSEHDAAEQRKAEAIRRRWSTARRAIGGIVGSSMVIGAGWYGVNHWILEPREQERIALEAYDAEDHQLPGEGLVLIQQQVTTIPRAEYDLIPEHDVDRDNLLSPRTEEVDAPGCYIVSGVSVASGEAIKVSVREGSVYEDMEYSAQVDDQGKLHLCLDTGVTQVEEPIKIAMQIQSNNE